MSVRQMGLVWELDLEKPLKFTLLALADHADHNGDGARPSVGLLAWKTGDTRRTIQRHLRQLEGLGLIVPIYAPTGGLVRSGHGGNLVGRATTYRLTLDKGAKLPPFTPRSLSPGNPQGATPVAEKGDTTRGEVRHP